MCSRRWGRASELRRSSFFQFRQPVRRCGESSRVSEREREQGNAEGALLLRRAISRRAKHRARHYDYTSPRPGRVRRKRALASITVFDHRSFRAANSSLAADARFVKTLRVAREPSLQPALVFRAVPCLSARCVHVIHRSRLRSFVHSFVQSSPTGMATMAATTAAAASSATAGAVPGSPTETSLSTETCGSSSASSVDELSFTIGVTEGTPYPCQFCDKAFPRLSYLKRHEQVSALLSSSVITSREQ